MFYIVAVFICIQVFIMYKRVETIPFFIFDLYSGKARASNTGVRISYYLDGKYFDTHRLSSRESETLLGSYDYYLALKSNQFYAADTSTIHNRFFGRVPYNIYQIIFKRLTNKGVNDSIYLNWWRRYFEQVAGHPVNSISRVSSTLLYFPTYKVLNDTISHINYAFK
ncbi:MAG TPA: hypothetical protein VFQ58_02725 [Flavisolibacter sp.]|nr:hypothetical protein [Flavisolibacter sp.]